MEAAEAFRAVRPRAEAKTNLLVAPILSLVQLEGKTKARAKTQHLSPQAEEKDRGAKKTKALWV